VLFGGVSWSVAVAGRPTGRPAGTDGRDGGGAGLPGGESPRIPLNLGRLGYMGNGMAMGFGHGWVVCREVGDALFISSRLKPRAASWVASAFMLQHPYIVPV